MSALMVEGPYILWINYGCYEGWAPMSYKTLKEAFDANTFGNEFVITTKTEYEVIEKK